MADLYVKARGAGDAGSGASWALSKDTSAGVVAVDAPGDRIFYSSTHTESGGSALVFALAGTAASPSWVMSVNDSAQPPTTTQPGATVTTTGTSAITFTGASIYVEGFTFNCATGTSSVTMGAATGTVGGRSMFRDCNFTINCTGSTSRISAVPANGILSLWVSCNVRFAAATQGVALGSNGRFHWQGGGLLSGGVAPNILFPVPGAGTNALVENVDLSLLGSAANLISAGTGGNAKVVLRKCKLPPAWTGALATGTLVTGDRHEMHDCDSGDTNYRLLIADYLGTIRNETATVLGGGATDGAVPFSLVMASNTLSRFPHAALASPEIMAVIEDAGAPVTVSVEVLTDGVTLTNEDCWLEVSYPADADDPLGAAARGLKSNFLATPTDWPSSTEAWVSAPGAPVAQRLSVTFTPLNPGVVHVVVRLARASTVVYVDPDPTVT